MHHTLLNFLFSKGFFKDELFSLDIFLWSATFKKHDLMSPSENGFAWLTNGPLINKYTSVMATFSFFLFL